MEEFQLLSIFLGLLPVVMSGEWSMRALPRRAISRSCVVIPCTFDFPSRPYTALHGAWFKYWYYWKYTVTYTKDPKYGMATFVDRAKIIGNLEEKNCSLRIDKLQAGDSDVYYFYVDLENFQTHTFKEPVQLQVLDLPDKPDVSLPKNLMEGTSAHVICKSTYTCPDNRPILTWSELPNASTNTVTENNGEISTVLTFNPTFKHHGLTVTCTSDYPETSHRLAHSVTLSVKYSPHNTSISMTLKKGKMVSLSCSSDGNPTVHTFSWMKIVQGKDTDLRQVGETITVPHGSGEETSYYCKATNALGSSRSLPVRIPTEYATAILPGSRCTQYPTNLTCLCLVRSNSSVDVRWHVPGSTIGATGSGELHGTRSARDGLLVTHTLTIRSSNQTIEAINCSVASEGGARLMRQLEVKTIVETSLELKHKIGWIAAGGVVLMIVSTSVIYFITKACRRNGKSEGNGMKQAGIGQSEGKSEMVLMSSKPKTSRYEGIISTQDKMNKKDEGCLKVKSNQRINPQQKDAPSETYEFDESSVYANV